MIMMIIAGARARGARSRGGPAGRAMGAWCTRSALRPERRSPTNIMNTDIIAISDIIICTSIITITIITISIIVIITIIREIVAFDKLDGSDEQEPWQTRPSPDAPGQDNII